MNDFIQWPRAKYWDEPWNPVVGCRHASPACDNCYARTAMVERFGQSFDPHPTRRQHPPKKGIVFAGNMTDLFGEWVPTAQIYDWFSEMWTYKKHVGPCPNPATYLWLTKRARRLGDCVTDYTECPNAYFGFTAENQEWFNRRMDDIVLTWPQKAKLWVSFEPLLGPIDMGPVFKESFEWVVVGCESGPHRRPCGMGWVESIVAQCMGAKIPVFVKQLDLNGRCETDINRFPAHLRIRQVPWARPAEGGKP